MGGPEWPWKIAWTIMFLLVVLVAIFSTAASNGLVVFHAEKVDFGVLLLTASAVILTGVAVILAIGALWGFDKLREAAVKAAEARAEETAAKIAAGRTDEIVNRLFEARVQREESRQTATGSIVDAFPRT